MRFGFSFRLYTVFLLLTALAFGSCTIRKRHYMPGYHIEWKHKTSTEGRPDTETKKEGSLTTPENTAVSHETKKPEDSRVASNQENTTETTVKEQEKPQTDASSSSLAEYTEALKKQSGTNYATKDIASSHVKSSKKKIKLAARNDDSGAGKGLYLILVGLLLCLLGYVFFLLLGAFGLILWWIFVLAGSILILIGLIVLLLSLI